MAIGGFKFLLLTFQCLVGLAVINLVYRMNLFRYQQFESYHLRAVVPTARRQGATA